MGLQLQNCLILLQWGYCWSHSKATVLFSIAFLPLVPFMHNQSNIKVLSRKSRNKYFTGLKCCHELLSWHILCSIHESCPCWVYLSCVCYLRISHYSCWLYYLSLCWNYFVQLIFTLLSEYKQMQEEWWKGGTTAQNKDRSDLVLSLIDSTAKHIGRYPYIDSVWSVAPIDIWEDIHPW
jgi:hypothetical protein